MLVAIADMDNLRTAYLKAVKGKRGRDEVRLYTENLDENLCRLRERLRSGRVETGYYRFFYSS